VNGENQHTRVRQIGEGSTADRFTASTAAATGKAERNIQRAAARGEALGDDSPPSPGQASTRAWDWTSSKKAGRRTDFCEF